MNARHFHELRLRLVDCRATFRAAKDQYEHVKAQTTERTQPQGKNAEERAVALTLALTKDGDYKAALAELRAAETEVERVQALLDAARDERRASEWQIRAQLADGLFRAGVPNEGADDEAFDDAADTWIDYIAEDEARDSRINTTMIGARHGHDLDSEDFPF